MDADKAYTANKKSWKKAHLTLCVLDGIREAKCSFPSCPRVKSMLGADAKAISDSSCKALTGCESGGLWNSPRSGPGWCGAIDKNGKVGSPPAGCECTWAKSALPGKKYMEMPANKKFCEDMVAKSKDPARWGAIGVLTGWKLRNWGNEREQKRFDGNMCSFIQMKLGKPKQSTCNDLCPGAGYIVPWGLQVPPPSQLTAWIPPRLKATWATSKHNGNLVCIVKGK